MTDAARLLTPGEVAVMFRVGPTTAARWAIDGRLGCIRTLGGHRRFLEAEVAALLAVETAPATRATG
jgi:excisionase family DNA binding protein